MPSILAIDSSTDLCSVALHHAGITRELCSSSVRQHANETLPMVRALLAEAELRPAELNAVAVTHGPGSFTGLRIGSAIAQGIAFAHALPVITVSSLAAIALQTLARNARGAVQVAMQARDNEVYWAAYQISNHSVTLLGREQVISLDNIDSRLDESLPLWNAAGDAWKVDGALRSRIMTTLVSVHPDLQPRASAILQLALGKFERGDTVSAEDAIPVYLKEELEYRSDGN